jgi:hypothetical protein
MRLTLLLSLGLAALVSAQSLTTILAANNATLSTLTSTPSPTPYNPHPPTQTTTNKQTITAGIGPTAIFIPTTIPLNGRPLATVPTAALMLAGGAAVLAANI